MEEKVVSAAAAKADLTPAVAPKKGDYYRCTGEHYTDTKPGNCPVCGVPMRVIGKEEYLAWGPKVGEARRS